MSAFVKKFLEESQGLYYMSTSVVPVGTKTVLNTKVGGCGQLTSSEMGG